MTDSVLFVVVVVVADVVSESISELRRFRHYDDQYWLMLLLLLTLWYSIVLCSPAAVDLVSAAVSHNRSDPTPISTIPTWH